MRGVRIKDHWKEQRLFEQRALVASAVGAILLLLLDRNGETLAGGQPGYQLELVHEEVPDLDATLKGLVGIGLLERGLEADLLMFAHGHIGNG